MHIALSFAFMQGVGFTQKFNFTISKPIFFPSASCYYSRSHQHHLQTPRRRDLHQRRELLPAGPGGQRLRHLAQVRQSQERVGNSPSLPPTVPTTYVLTVPRRRDKIRETQRDRESVRGETLINRLLYHSGAMPSPSCFYSSFLKACVDISCDRANKPPETLHCVYSYLNVCVLSWVSKDDYEQTGYLQKLLLCLD